MSSKSILIVATSSSSFPDNGDPTGLWLEELAAPYLIWVKAGFKVDIVSIKGGKIPLDPTSLTPESLSALTLTFHGDEKLMSLTETTHSVKDVTGEYDAIYLPGGLVNPKSANGEPLVKGKKVSGFSNTEEEAVGKTKRIPFLLETELINKGGLYEKGPDFTVYAVADGKLVTGQNPMSSEKVAELVVEALPSVTCGSVKLWKCKSLAIKQIDRSSPEKDTSQK